MAIDDTFALKDKIGDLPLTGGAPDKSEYSEIAYIERRDWLRRCLEQMRKIDPENATPVEISTTLSVLLCAGVPIGILKEYMKVSKTTIKRWIAKEAPPRAIYRPVVIKNAIFLMEIILEKNNQDDKATYNSMH